MMFVSICSMLLLFGNCLLLETVHIGCPTCYQHVWSSPGDSCDQLWKHIVFMEISLFLSV